MTRKEHKQFLKGDAKVFSLLFNKVEAILYAVARRYTRCEDDANEVLQISFIKIYEKRALYKPEYPVEPWMKKITINSALEFIRQNYRVHLIEHEEDFNLKIEEEIDSENISDLKKHLMKALAQLPDGYRTVFNLFVIDNLTHLEIAEHLGITASTSRSQLAKARVKLREFINKEQTSYERVG